MIYKEFKRKLTLNKSTVSNLNKRQMHQIQGGETVLPQCPYPPTFWIICPTKKMCPAPYTFLC